MSGANHPPGARWAQHWLLEPGLRFLNHGSFGACPIPVLARQHELRERMEREPVRFFVRELEELQLAARQALATLLRADADDLALVPNATAGVNTVVRSLEFETGDEVLTTDHEYRACHNALEYAALRARARIVVAPVPFPTTDPGQVLESVMARVTARTRLVLLDHVTSPTGQVWPIAELVAALSSRGVDTLVDGAHGPGQVPLDLTALGAAYYTGNCHKWLCAPKGAAFLHVRKDLQTLIRPLGISHGAGEPLGGRSRFRAEFDWTGTDDPTAHLCIPAAVEFLESLLPGGLPALMARNRALALEGRRILCEALGCEPPCPESMVGSMASMPLPDGLPEPPRSPLYTDPLQDRLLLEHGIEVPVVPWPAPPKRLLRISAQAYNEPDDYRALAGALRDCLGR